MTSVNNRIVRIPSSTTKEKFLDAVCPFDVTPDVIEMGEGTFDILRISTHDRAPLFYALLDDDAVTGLVIENPPVHRVGITEGSTFGELRKTIPSVVVTRSEIEGEVVGSDEHFSFFFWLRQCRAIRFKNEDNSGFCKDQADCFVGVGG